MSNVNEIGRGQLFYKSLDGSNHHYPGPDPWYPGDMSDADLAVLQILCMRTLGKVNQELEKRGLR